MSRMVNGRRDYVSLREGLECHEHGLIGSWGELAGEGEVVSVPVGAVYQTRIPP